MQKRLGEAATGSLAVAAEPVAHCAERSRPFVVAATVMASAMAFIDSSVVHLALPRLQSDFGAGFDALQWVINGYTLFLSAFILTGGGLGDRYGRRRIFVYGITVFALASLVCALAPSIGVLIAGRVVQGFGAALMVPQCLALLSASFPQEMRGRAIGLWAGASALTTAAGPIIGGLFIDLLSWRAVFWINLPLAIAAVGIALWHVPESRSAQTGRLDWVGTVLIASAMGTWTYALTVMAESGHVDWRVAGLLIAGGALMSAFVAVEARSTAPLMPLGLFRSLRFAIANVITLLVYFALGAVLFLLSYTLIQIYGYSSLETAAAILPFGLMIGLFSSRAGRLADRFGAEPMLFAGSALVAAACLWFAFADSAIGGAYFVGVLPGVLMFATGMTAVVAPLSTAVMNAAPEGLSGAASGINNTASRFAGVLAVAVIGLIMLTLFSAGLKPRLEALGVPEPLQRALMADAIKLGGLQAPENAGDALSRDIRNAIESAYRAAYSRAMLLIGISAGIAVLLSLLLLRRRE